MPEPPPADVSAKAPRDLLVVNTHFDHASAEARREGAKVLVEFVSRVREAHPSIAVIVMTGTERAFSAGADLKEAEANRILDAAAARRHVVTRGCTAEHHRAPPRTTAASRYWPSMMQYGAEKRDEPG